MIPVAPRHDRRDREGRDSVARGHPPVTNTKARISESATASPANSAVPFILLSFEIRPLAYSDTGTMAVPIAVALPVNTLLKPAKVEVLLK